MSKAIKQESSVLLEWTDLHFSVDVPVERKPKLCNPKLERKPIIRGVSGRARPGRLLAIMGASGSGKSSLLKLLNKRVTDEQTPETHVSGDVIVNGVPSTRDVFAEHAAFVIQEDVLLPTFTVRESLMFSAELRLPADTTPAEREARVNEVIEQLDLQRCADTLVGDALLPGLSGGEKKRLSIGIELVHRPKVLFCDEPTSGLDSHTAFAVVDQLKTLAAAGRTVVATIHQPSSDIFMLFDDILILHRGRTAFHGPAQECVPFFEQHGFACAHFMNPADHFISSVITMGEDDMVRMMDSAEQRIKAAAEESKEDQVPPPLEPNPKQDQQDLGFWTETKILSIRSWTNFLRQPMLLKVRLAQTVFLALFVGLIYLGIGSDQRGVQNRNGAIFFVTTTNFILSVLSVVLNFPAEKLVFMRESVGARLYGTGSYFISKSISEVPFQVLFPVVYCVISYFLIGFQLDAEKFAVYVAANVVSVSAGQSLGLVVGCATPDAQTAVSVTPLCMLPFMVFNSLFLNSNDVPPYFAWIEAISPFKYAFSITAVNEYRGLELHCTSDQEFGGICPFTRGEQVLQLYSLDGDDRITIDFAVLLALLVGFRFIAYLFLRRQSK